MKNTPRLALAGLLATLSAAAFAQPLAQAPNNNPCLAGAGGCASGGGIMDPMTEGALIGLGEPMIPNALPRAPKIAASKMETAPAVDETEAVAQLGVGIGGIINPSGGPMIASKGPSAGGPSTLGAAFGGGDSGSIAQTIVPSPDAGSFSFRKMQKASAAANLLEKDVPAPDNGKLNPGDDGLAPGGIRADSNR
jgi:hypothetical protein